MSKYVPYDKNAVCDGCGKIGAYDFMGDLYCFECSEHYGEEDEDEIEDE